jgi:hypothetical protein
LRQPETYHCAEELGRLRWISRLPVVVLRALLPLAPNWNWVLRKPMRAHLGEAACAAQGDRSDHKP